MITVQHKGFKVSGDDIAANIRDTDGYVEIMLTDRHGEHKQSFDLNGLQTLIEDLRQILTLAEQVGNMNNRVDRERTE